MRKTTKDAYDAFINKKNFYRGNTSVVIYNNKPILLLFGNKIAKIDENGDIWISDGEWGVSSTTRDRLSAFIRIRISKETFIIDEKFEWNGSWFNISEYKRNNGLV